MRIMVMGAGALGCYFGGRMQQAGSEVSLVTRGAHLAAMQAEGLRIESPLGDLHLREVTAVADPAEAPRPDAVLFMVKNRDVEAAAARLLPVLGPDTQVVTVQNGMSAPDRLAATIGPERVIAGAVYMPADIRAPGVVRHSAPFHRLVLGVPGSAPSPACRALAVEVAASGIEVEVAEDIDAVLWEKFVMLSSFAALCALTRLDIGPIRETPLTRDLLRAALDEAVAVGQAACPTLPPEAAERSWIALTERFPRHGHASMLDDLLRGRPIELNWLSGDLVRLGRLHGIATPVHAMVTAALQPYADGPPA